jgi:hypothetical protein
MIALVPTVSCLMGKNDVAVTSHFVEPCPLFEMLIGYPSSKKSVRLNLIKTTFITANNHVNYTVKKLCCLK